MRSIRSRGFRAKPLRPSPRSRGCGVLKSGIARDIGVVCRGPARTIGRWSGARGSSGHEDRKVSGAGSGRARSSIEIAVLAHHKGVRVHSIFLRAVHRCSWPTHRPPARFPGPETPAFLATRKAARKSDPVANLPRVSRTRAVDPGGLDASRSASREGRPRRDLCFGRTIRVRTLRRHPGKLYHQVPALGHEHL